MKGAANTVALNRSAMPKMRAKMRAISIEKPRLSLLVTEQDEVAAEIADWPHIADREVGAIAYPEPAMGDGHRKAIDLWQRQSPSSCHL